MSTSTLPKSVQAGKVNSETGEAINLQERIDQYKAFIDTHRHLPEDFLRIPTSSNQRDAIVMPQERAVVAREVPLVDMVDISVVEAQLVKNYGILRMDLYCKIRVGHMVCETQTCVNGAKNPKWDGVYQFSLKPGIDTIHIEIYDEKQFSPDEKIAWLYEPIPAEVFQGITVERWFPLSGRLGTNKEGSILLVLSHKRVPMRPSNLSRSHQQGQPFTVIVPAANQGPIIGTGGPGTIPTDPHMTTFPQPAIQYQQPSVQGVESEPAAQEDIDQLSEMFPSIDKAVIKAVLENNRNDKEATIGALLALG